MKKGSIPFINYKWQKAVRSKKKKKTLLNTANNGEGKRKLLTICTIAFMGTGIFEITISTGEKQVFLNILYVKGKRV